MKRNHLIPREKSKKVIYLDPRGRGVGEKHYGARALYVLAVLCRCTVWGSVFLLPSAATFSWSGV